MQEVYRLDRESRLYLPDSRAEIIHTSAVVLAENLSKQETPSGLFDMDGVIFDGNSLHRPKLITPQIIPALARLEERGVAIGPATARGKHVIDFLRAHGLRMEGPGILEGGHVFIQGERTDHIAIPGHTDFIRDLRIELTDHESHATTWEEVKERAMNGEKAFCHGNYQWQGDCRSSFWFMHDGSKERAEEIANELFRPAIETMASAHDLDPQIDVQTSVTLMNADNLAIFGIKGNVLGKPVNKATVLREFMRGSWILAADGEGDFELAKVTQDRGGVVVGIKSHLDKSDEVDKFLAIADTTMETPQEFVQLLNRTADLLAA